MPARPRPSLRARLLRGLGALVAIILVSTLLSVMALRRLGGAVGLILKENYASVVACEEMNEALERQDSAALFIASGHEDIGGPMLRENRPLFAAAFEREARNITLPNEGRLVEEIRALHADYVRQVEVSLHGDTASKLDAYFKELLPRFRALKERIASVLRINQANMEEADRQARELSRLIFYVAVSVSVLALVIAAWLGRWLTRSISEPLVEFTARARAIGEGDLTGGVERPEPEELAQLADAFNRMLERLRAYRESSLGELLAAQDLSQATVECMLDPVIVFDREGGVLLANESAQGTFALAPANAEELRAESIEIPEGLRRARDDVLATGKPVLPQSFAESMRWISEGGTERHFLVRAAPLRAETGEKPNAIVVAQDVTRFRRIDELKSDVVATVSHELKTPLTALRLATHMLLDPATGTLTAGQRELAETARDDTERLRATVDELLDLVRIEREAGALRRARVAVITVLTEVVEVHRPVAASKGVELVIAPFDETRTVDADPEKLTVVLSNLVSNAIRHAPTGTAVKLTIDWRDGFLDIGVHDDGEGIAEEDLPRIFERNFRGGDGQKEGRHGLGLAIAREIVEHHGGTIDVETRRGAGSVFRIRLPAPSD
jgi:NtrC-family two-component system sensor histidine kinase KinB